jgi:translation initiation factor 3 subunit C
MKENRRQIPYHMHINLDLIDACHMISAMLLEVPNMAAQEFDVKRRPLSKNFRHALDKYERQVFTGPPESTKDYVLAASKALEDGEWQRARDLILGLKVWKLWEGIVSRADKVKAQVEERLKEAAIRTYMFSYSPFYSTISLSKLSVMFELPKDKIHRIISKMMLTKELKASWDQTTESILLHREDPTRLQKYAMVFAERLTHFVENNERLIDFKSGGQEEGQRGGRKEGDYAEPRSFRRGRRGYVASDRNDRGNSNWQGEQQYGGGRRPNKKQ